MSIDTDLQRLRSEFPILATTVYMNSNSLGAMPRAVYDEMRAFADLWATRGVRAWHDGWIDMVSETGDLYADVLDAEHGTVTMLQNVTIAEWIIASCFEFTPRRPKVVYTDMNFPSVMYVWEEQRRRGAEVVMVPSEDGIRVDLQKLLDAIDERTLLVPVSHVLFRSAFIQNAAAIVEKAHKVGAMVVLDTYQSAGCVPVSAKKLGVDFIVGGSVKWLCGGPGAGYMYVRPDLAKRLRPMNVGWFAHKRPFQFETGAVDLRDGAGRFDSGTPHIPALYAARSGVRIIRDLGVERIRRNSLALTDRIIERAERRGFELTVPRDHEHRGGTVAFNVPHSRQVTKELLAREFIVDWRPLAGIRVSPHFYSTAAECDRTVDEISAILDSRAYEKHSDDIY